MVDAYVSAYLFDRDVSAAIYEFVTEYFHEDVIFCFKLLEYTLHGIPWLVFSLVFALLSVIFDTAQETRDGSIILLTGLIFDLIAIGILKIVFRRPRPIYNKDDQIYEAPIVDKYSFPSGHTSRMAMLAVFALNLMHGHWSIFYLFIKCFPYVLGLTRIMLGRHFLFDVVGGLLLGYFEGIFLLSTSSYYVPRMQNFILRCTSFLY